MSAAEQLVPWKDPEQRARTIGSSDAAAACGVDPNRSQLQLYLEKRGEIERQPAGDAAFFGTLLEPVLLRVLAMREGLHVVGRDEESEPVLWDPDGRRRPAPFMEPDLLGTLTHATEPWMVAHLDAVVPTRGFAEAKTAGAFVDGWGDEDDAIPEPYLVQIHHQAAILRSLGQPWETCWVPSLRGGQRWRVYVPPIVPDLMDAIMEREAEFWCRVRDGNPPDPDARDLGILRELYPRHAEREVISQPGDLLDRLARELAAAKTAKDAAEEAESAARARIQALMQDASKVVGSSWSITWKNIKDGEAIDWRGALGAVCDTFSIPDAEQARIVALHTTTKPGYRRFSPNLKKISGGQ